MSDPSRKFRQSDTHSKLEKKGKEANSCVDARADSLKCLTKYAAHSRKSEICSSFFEEHKSCIRRQSDKLKADRIAARGGSRW